MLNLTDGGLVEHLLADIVAELHPVKRVHLITVSVNDWSNVGIDRQANFPQRLASAFDCAIIGCN